MADEVVKPIIKKVAVGICLKGHTPPESYHDRMMMAFNLGIYETEQRLVNHPVQYQFMWFSAGEIFVAFARDQLAKMAVDHGCDYLFMVDDDMLCPPDLFYQLVHHNVDIVAPLAFTRNPPHNPVMFSVKEGWDTVAKSEYYITHPVKSYPRNKLVECDAVGFGAVLIKTEVIKKVPTPWFMSTSPTGEDILFCNKAKKMGAKVFMDTSIKLGHLGRPNVITEEYADEYNKTDEKERELRYGKYEKYPSLDMTR